MEKLLNFELLRLPGEHTRPYHTVPASRTVAGRLESSAHLQAQLEAKITKHKSNQDYTVKSVEFGEFRREAVERPN